MSTSTVNRNGKTAKKTAKVRLAPPSGRNGNRLPVGAHPGNTGGKKGRSGRRPNEHVEWCRSMISDPTHEAEVVKVLANADHPAYATMWKEVRAVAYGKPVQPHEHGGANGGDITIRVVRERRPVEAG